jgi:hypothetical protein
MIDNNHELTICELDAVNGGFGQIIAEIAALKLQQVQGSTAPGSGGQNDLAHVFQQILGN